MHTRCQFMTFNVARCYESWFFTDENRSQKVPAATQPLFLHSLSLPSPPILKHLSVLPTTHTHYRLSVNTTLSCMLYQCVISPCSSLPRFLFPSSFGFLVSISSVYRCPKGGKSLYNGYTYNMPSVHIQLQYSSVKILYMVLVLFSYILYRPFCPIWVIMVIDLSFQWLW